MLQFGSLTETLGGIRRLVAPLAVVAMMAASASAAPVEFGTFNSPNGGQEFSFTNNGGTSGTITASAPVTFNFTAASGMSTVDRQAILTINGTTFTPANALPGSFVDQRISGPASLSLIEVGTGKNLLSITAFTGDIIGKLGSPNAALSGADTSGDTVTFTSDFLTFMQPGNSYNLGLAGITPVLSIGPGGFLNTFLANVNGQFSAMVFAVPAPTSVAMLGTGLVAAAVLATQRKRLAKLNRS